MTRSFLKNKIYRVLKIVNKDNKTRKGFKYPNKGLVKCPDWEPIPCCGNGLHGYLPSKNDFMQFSVCGQEDLIRRKYLVIEVLGKDMIDLGGKVKFKEGKVIYSGRNVEKVFELMGNMKESEYKDALCLIKNIFICFKSHYFSRCYINFNGHPWRDIPRGTFFEAKTYIKVPVEKNTSFYLKSGTGEIYIGDKLIKVKRNKIYRKRYGSGDFLEEINP